MLGQNASDDEYFHDDDFVWAVSKKSQGSGYTLDQELYQTLVKQVGWARGCLDAKIDYMKKYIDPAGSLTTDNGNLTDLGLLADHFNLVKARKFVGTFWGQGKWELPKHYKASHVHKEDLRVLYNTVLRVLEVCLQGLSKPLVIRGKSGKSKDVSKDTAGYVVRRRGRLKGDDSDFPEEVGGGKRPRIEHDMIFLYRSEQAKGNIHLDYNDIPLDSENQVTRFSTCCFWTVIHEATHKFARTRDVDSPRCYEVLGRRKMHWTDAVRNASHYELYAGIDSAANPEFKSGVAKRNADMMWKP